MQALFVIGALLFAGAATAAPNKKQAKTPNWSITGWEVTTCCCKDICPCRYNEKPTHMECESFVNVHVDKGFFGNTKLTDVNFILVSRGITFDGSKGWNKVYFDNDTSAKEREAVGGILTTILGSYKPETAKLLFGEESRGAKVVPMTFKKLNGGLVREVDCPGVTKIRARLGKIPGAAKPMHVLNVLTEFSPIFYPAAEVSARAIEPEVKFDHPEHHRAEVEDFTLTKAQVVSRKIGFQAFTGKGGCLLK